MPGGRHQIGIPAGFNSESVAGFLGIRNSLHRGYPSGFMLLWETGAGLKGIGTNGKEEAPSLAIVDGQQRLTSLYAVMTGAEIIRADYSRERIKIAFDPLSERFEVANAATAQDRAFISNVAEVWAPGANAFQLANDYLSELGKVRELTKGRNGSNPNRNWALGDADAASVQRPCADDRRGCGHSRGGVCSDKRSGSEAKSGQLYTDLDVGLLGRGPKGP